MTRSRPYLPALAAALALAGLLAAAWVRYPGFNPAHILTSLLAAKAHLLILACGATWVILARGLDLSVGSVMALCAVSAALLIRAGWHPAPAAAAAAALGLGLGLLNGAAIACLGLRPFIVTLVMMFVARGLTLVISEVPVSIDHPAHAALAALSLNAAGMELRITAAIALAAAATLWAADRLFPIRLHVRALGDNPDAARSLGVPVRRTTHLVYGVSGLLAAIAGLTLTLYLPTTSHDDGLGLEIDAIAAIVIGGTALSGGRGSIPGTAAGVLLVSLASLLPTYEPGLSPGLVKLVIGGLLLACVLAQRAAGGAGHSRGAITTAVP
jgi:galactofuranose transport system permease protein